MLRITESKYHFPLLVAYLFVFFNSFLLPNGLFYTTLLAPVFLYNSLRYGIVKPYLFFFVFFCVFLCVHQYLNLNYKDYFRTNFLVLMNVIFLTNCYSYFNRVTESQINKLFKQIVYFNFLITVVAIVAFFIPLLKPVFWYLIPVTAGSGIVPRLKMLWSEASIYSLVLSPFFLYFFWQNILMRKKLGFSLVLLIIFPLALSNSMGVCVGLLVSVFCSFLYFRKSFFSTQMLLQIVLLLIVVIMTVSIWYWLDKDNVFFLRLHNLVAGKDTSARGRTFEAFIIAQKLLNQYHCWWMGIGPGQFKIMGKELLLNYYKYSGNITDIRVPNACADTLIVYGIVGFVLRIGIQLYLFFKTKVFQNVFRFSLFIFLFIYQFTGSYFNNLIEWTFWILVFSKAFIQFNNIKNKIPQ